MEASIAHEMARFTSCQYVDQELDASASDESVVILIDSPMKEWKCREKNAVGYLFGQVFSRWSSDRGREVFQKP